MEDSLLLTILQDQTKLATRTEQKVEDLNKRLFGNGQPGVIQIIHTTTIETSAKLAKTKDDLESRIAEVDAAHRLDRRWVAGALAIIVFEGTVAAFYFKYIYSAIHSLVR